MQSRMFSSIAACLIAILASCPCLLRAEAPVSFEWSQVQDLVAQDKIPNVVDPLPFQQFFGMAQFFSARRQLIEKMERDKDGESARTLAALRDPACLSYYLPIIEDDSRPFAERHEAALTICTIDGRWLRSFWLHYRNEANPVGERYESIRLLLRCHYPGAAEVLGDLLPLVKDRTKRDELIRLAAAELPRYRKQLRDQIADEARPAYARLLDIAALVKLDEPVVARVVRRLVKRHKTKDVRTLGLHLLAKMQDRTYYDKLRAIADDETRSVSLRRFAIDVLTQYGDESRLGTLIALAATARDTDQVKACYEVVLRQLRAERVL